MFFGYSVYIIHYQCHLPLTTFVGKMFEFAKCNFLYRRIVVSVRFPSQVDMTTCPYFSE